MLLDALNYRTHSFTRMDGEIAPETFQSLVTVGDVIHRMRKEPSSFDGGDPSDVPLPPPVLVAKLFCESAVSHVRGDVTNADIRAFLEELDFYNLDELKAESPWIDQTPLTNCRASLRHVFDGIKTRFLEDDGEEALSHKLHADDKALLKKRLSKYNTAKEVNAELAKYVAAVVKALGPSFLEKVAADVLAGTYAPKSDAAPGEPAVLVPVDEAKEKEAAAAGKKPSKLVAMATGAREKAPAPSPKKRAAAAGDAWGQLNKHLDTEEEAAAAANAAVPDPDDVRATDSEGAADSDSDSDSDSDAPSPAARRRARGVNIQPQARKRGAVTVEWDEGRDAPGRAVASGSGPKATPGSVGRKRYTRWSAAEEAALERLVTKHGEGKWAEALREGKREGSLREELTSVMIKDKWRTMQSARKKRRGE
jgi:hypothetical protein